LLFATASMLGDNKQCKQCLKESKMTFLVNLKSTFLGCLQQPKNDIFWANFQPFLSLSNNNLMTCKCLDLVEFQTPLPDGQVVAERGALGPGSLPREFSARPVVLLASCALHVLG